MYKVIRTRRHVGDVCLLGHECKTHIDKLLIKASLQVYQYCCLRKLSARNGGRIIYFDSNDQLYTYITMYIYADILHLCHVLNSIPFPFCSVADTRQAPYRIHLFEKYNLCSEKENAIWEHSKTFEKSFIKLH